MATNITFKIKKSSKKFLKKEKKSPVRGELEETKNKQGVIFHY